MSLQALAEEQAEALYQLSLRRDQRMFAVQIILTSYEGDIVMIDCAGTILSRLAWCRTNLDASFEDEQSPENSTFAKLMSTEPWTNLSCAQSLQRLKEILDQVHEELDIGTTYDRFQFSIVRSSGS